MTPRNIAGSSAESRAINSSTSGLMAAVRSRRTLSMALRMAGCSMFSSFLPCTRAALISFTEALCSTSRETITPTSLMGSLVTSVVIRLTSSPCDFLRCSTTRSTKARNALFSSSNAVHSVSDCCIRNIRSCQSRWISSSVGTAPLTFSISGMI